MTGLIFVQPVEGRRVRKPDGAALDPAGEMVPADPYWVRRQIAGDISSPRFSGPRFSDLTRKTRRKDPA